MANWNFDPEITALAGHMSGNWHVTNTGGNCMAIEANFANGYVLVTGYNETLWDKDLRTEHPDDFGGWTVGMYSTDDRYPEFVGMAGTTESTIDALVQCFKDAMVDFVAQWSK